MLYIGNTGKGNTVSIENAEDIITEKKDGVNLVFAEGENLKATFKTENIDEDIKRTVICQGNQAIFLFPLETEKAEKIKKILPYVKNFFSTAEQLGMDIKAEGVVFFNSLFISIFSRIEEDTILLKTSKESMRKYFDELQEIFRFISKEKDKIPPAEGLLDALEGTLDKKLREKVRENFKNVSPITLKVLDYYTENHIDVQITLLKETPKEYLVNNIHSINLEGNLLKITADKEKISHLINKIPEKIIQFRKELEKMIEKEIGQQHEEKKENLLLETIRNGMDWKEILKDLVENLEESLEQFSIDDYYVVEEVYHSDGRSEKGVILQINLETEFDGEGVYFSDEIPIEIKILIENGEIQVKDNTSQVLAGYEDEVRDILIDRLMENDYPCRETKDSIESYVYYLGEEIRLIEEIVGKVVDSLKEQIDKHWDNTQEKETNPKPAKNMDNSLVR